MSDINLTIGKEVVTPIVEAKISQAIIEAMGGQEDMIAKVVSGILDHKVDSNGKVSSYDRDNKHTWLDIVITQKIKAHAEAAIKEVLQENTKVIKEALVNQLQTKKGANMAAKALLDAMSGSFSSGWRSNIDISLEPISCDD